MKKSILNLGKILNKADQKAINGGGEVSGVCKPEFTIDMNGDKIFTCEGHCCVPTTNGGCTVTIEACNINGIGV
ncbi:MULTISPECIES: hypothetical protein [unclassified Tenacibaculum]|uniref:hypothetical protein n=1 Tax=unclassified Tenacibaculum TaxID=2635139 RepID=UPI001F358F6C|nr:MULTISPECIES: hypothetical protein [unclassified Tenacibaculum]MCF2876638.1 hypothetical protein [Tenacibaculum sp. Cn5-1]MCF2936789.1 hypothetical protein [Tenacibaculum sp. Cn5-34]MCG7511756.1 hypothetical protein [Tenacibaculum sp. Cn5-46]